MGSSPNGHVFAGWGLDAETVDARIATSIIMLFGLRETIWPRRLHSASSRVVDLTLVLYSDVLSEQLMNAVLRAAQTRRKLWPITGGDIETPVKNHYLPTTFTVQVYVKSDTNPLESVPYWKRTVSFFKRESIQLQVHHFIPD